jgi:hypothetical protein
MKTSMTTPPSRVPGPTAFKAAACATTLAALLALATTVQAQTIDNFDSGGFDPAAGWATFNNTVYPTTYTFPTDAFGGHALRMQGGVPSNAGDNGFGTARAAAICTNQSYSDFYVAADLVNWDTNFWHQTNYTFVGLAARVTTNLVGVATGTNWSGVALFYWLNVDTQENPPGPGTAVMGLGYVVNGLLDFAYPMISGGVAPASVAEWTLEPGHSYRLTFQGVGKDLTGKVYDTQDLTTPLGTLSGDTSLGDLAGLVLPPSTNGWSGLCTLRFNRDDNGAGTTDATFDNFYAAATPPTSPIIGSGTPHGMIGAPEVINRTPASWSNFYAYSGGISFTATTLTTTNNLNTSAIRLILNGVDVSSSLTITPTTPATNATVSFGGPGSSISLASNVVYDASIILEDASSFHRRTTNNWTFDTFTEAYLASASCKNIECEDYDISGGGYYNSPVTASGFSTNDNTWYVPVGSPTNIGYVFGINIYDYTGLENTYVGTPGAQAATSDDPSGTFYQCTRTTALIGQPANIGALANSGNLDLNDLFPACEFRNGAAGSGYPNYGGVLNGDAVGTEHGAAYGISVHNVVANNLNLFWDWRFDTKRQKYTALNAAGLAQCTPTVGPLPQYNATGGNTLPWWDVEEYTVVATEGSDWFNYSQDWGTTNSYNVYLRNACGATEVLNLYLGATTNRANLLGTFACTNALMWSFRYTPLVDANGTNAVVKLGGVKTLRLEIDPTMPAWTTIRRGMALNYLAFVPVGGAQLVTNVVYSTTNRITSVVKSAGTTFTVSALGTPGAQYYLVSSGNIKTAMGSWTPVTGSTNTASAGGTWSCTVSNSNPAYYRSVAVNPHP